MKLEQRAVWSTAYVNDLPDSAFLYIEDGGSKDSEGKTTPRSLRHFPVRDANGNVDVAHVRNALARIPQADVPQSAKDAATAKARKLLASANDQRAAGVPEPDGPCPSCGHALAHHDDGDGDGDNDGPCTAPGCDCPGVSDGVGRARVDDLELRIMHAPLTDIEVRDASVNADGTWTLSGYAAVFGQEGVLRDNKFIRRTESIDPAAFDTVLRTQGLSTPAGVVHLNYGHDMLSAIAATDVPANQPGSLLLRADRRGLGFLAKVSQDDADARRVVVKVRDGVARQASFLFAVARDRITASDLGDGRLNEHRTVLEVKRLADICICPQGVYPQTEANLMRSFAAALGQPVHVDDGGQHHVSRATIDARGEGKPRLTSDEQRRIRRQLRHTP